MKVSVRARVRSGCVPLSSGSSPIESRMVVSEAYLKVGLGRRVRVAAGPEAEASTTPAEAQTTGPRRPIRSTMML